MIYSKKSSRVEPVAALADESIEDATWSQVSDQPTNLREVGPGKVSLVKARVRQAVQDLYSRLKGERATVSFKADGSKALPLPIKVLIGYLPGVTKQDALEYALGVSARNMDQVSLVYYNAWPLGDGYAYEIQEGGSGLAFVPAILRHFESLGPFDARESANVVIETATRRVRVNRMASGLSALQLPRSADDQVSEWLTPKEKLKPAFALNTGVLVAGGILLSTGFIASLVMSVYRYQGVEPPPRPAQEVVTTQNTPLGQWQQLELVDPSQEYVQALKFENNRWIVQKKANDGATSPEATPN